MKLQLNASMELSANEKAHLGLLLKQVKVFRKLFNRDAQERSLGQRAFAKTDFQWNSFQDRDQSNRGLSKQVNLPKQIYPNKSKDVPRFSESQDSNLEMQRTLECL